jgi:hypothetical protein
MADTPKVPEKSGEQDLAARIRDLEATVKAQRAVMPQSLIPTHGAGEGDEVADTWSQAEQEEARANG